MSMKTSNAERIATLIQSSMEPAEPQTAILEFFRQNEGKRLDKRFLDKMKAQVGRDDLRYDFVAGMTKIKWGPLGSGREGMLFVSYATKGLIASSEEVLEHNPAYFGAREKRNESRAKALASPEAIEALAGHIEQFKAAREAIKKAFEHGGVFDQDQYEIREAFGLDEKR